jgi:hypothetical protein
LIGLGKEMSKRVAIMEVYNLMDLFGVCWGEGMSGEWRRRMNEKNGMKGKRVR